MGISIENSDKNSNWSNLIHSNVRYWFTLETNKTKTKKMFKIGF